ncbi:unnamed protein product [Amoebophrya sp. A120]|nr:unnamed protein product [Amoebophrya sp. A120]|eukprot:GSA120T00011490001.1
MNRAALAARPTSVKNAAMLSASAAPGSSGPAGMSSLNAAEKVLREDRKPSKPRSTFDDLFVHVTRAWKRMHATGKRTLPRTKIHGAQFVQILFDLRLVPKAPSRDEYSTSNRSTNDSSWATRKIIEAQKRIWKQHDITNATRFCAEDEVWRNEDAAIPYFSGNIDTMGHKDSSMLRARPVRLRLRGDGVREAKTAIETVERFLGKPPVIAEKKAASNSTASSDAKSCSTQQDPDPTAGAGAAKDGNSGTVEDGTTERESRRERRRRQQEVRRLARLDLGEEEQSNALSSSTPRTRRLSAPDVLDLMMQRGYYGQFIEKKINSAGPGRPPKLTLEECKKWAAFFYLEKLKQLNREENAERRSSASAKTISQSVVDHPESISSTNELSGAGTTPAIASATLVNPPVVTQDIGATLASQKLRRHELRSVLHRQAQSMDPAKKDLAAGGPAKRIALARNSRHSRRYRKRPREDKRCMY